MKVSFIFFFIRLNAKQFLIEKKDIASSIYRSIMEASGTVKEKMMEEKKQEKTSSENTVSEPEENK